MAEEGKKQAENAPDQMTAREYLESTMTEEERAAIEKMRYTMVFYAAALTGAVHYLQTHNFDGSDEKAAEFNATEEARILKDIIRSLKSPKAAAEEVSETFRDMIDLAPYLADEVEKLQQDLQQDEPHEIKLYNLLALGFSSDKDNPVCKPYIEAVERARKRAAEDKAKGKTYSEKQTTLDHLYPKSLSIVNTPIMNELAGLFGKDRINAGPFDAPAIPDRDITNYVVAEYEPEKGVASSLSEYERSILDSYNSIYLQAKNKSALPLFTEDDIFRLFPGDNDKANGDQRKAIKATLEKLHQVTIDIDATDEAIMRGVISEGERFVIKNEPLVDYREIEKTTKNGKKIKAYLIKGCPPLLYHAMMAGQIIPAPKKYLAIRVGDEIYSQRRRAD